MTAINPDEYMENGQGHLIPKDKVKPIDILRDDLVKRTLDRWMELQGIMQDFKDDTLGDIHTFIAMSAEQYGVTMGGKKGNVSLTTYDGKYKISLANSDTLSCDEQIQAAKILMDECAAEWTEGSRAEVKAIINDAFHVDREGNFSIARIFSLKRLDIDDPKWLKAMEAITNSVRIVGSKSYLRAHKRNEHGKWDAISLDFAAL